MFLDGSLNLEKRSVQLNGCVSFQEVVSQVGALRYLIRRVSVETKGNSWSNYKLSLSQSEGF